MTLTGVARPYATCGAALFVRRFIILCSTRNLVAYLFKAQFL
ncbi:MAG TPA: hypothetical protein PKV86_05995 [Syntrophobacteraceae bacterium]|nr:hypothetical protein [Syntrophobacteraceae bacterium]